MNDNVQKYSSLEKKFDEANLEKEKKSNLIKVKIRKLNLMRKEKRKQEKRIEDLERSYKDSEMEKLD